MTIQEKLELVEQTLEDIKAKRGTQYKTLEDQTVSFFKNLFNDETNRQIRFDFHSFFDEDCVRVNIEYIENEETGKKHFGSDFTIEIDINSLKVEINHGTVGAVRVDEDNFFVRRFKDINFVIDNLPKIRTFIKAACFDELIDLNNQYWQVESEVQKLKRQLKDEQKQEVIEKLKTQQHFYFKKKAMVYSMSDFRPLIQYEVEKVTEKRVYTTVNKTISLDTFATDVLEGNIEIL